VKPNIFSQIPEFTRLHHEAGPQSTVNHPFAMNPDTGEYRQSAAFIGSMVAHPTCHRLKTGFWFSPGNSLSGFAFLSPTCDCTRPKEKGRIMQNVNVFGLLGRKDLSGDLSGGAGKGSESPCFALRQNSFHHDSSTHFPI
jgi:hypothetical protein